VLYEQLQHFSGTATWLGLESKINLVIHMHKLLCRQSERHLLDTACRCILTLSVVAFYTLQCGVGYGVTALTLLHVYAEVYKRLHVKLQVLQIV
jgi:hypothetical protein